jgi:hypothetical protein
MSTIARAGAVALLAGLLACRARTDEKKPSGTEQARQAIAGPSGEAGAPPAPAPSTAAPAPLPPPPPVPTVAGVMIGSYALESVDGHALPYTAKPDDKVRSVLLGGSLSIGAANPNRADGGTFAIMESTQLVGPKVTEPPKPRHTLGDFRTSGDQITFEARTHAVLSHGTPISEQPKGPTKTFTGKVDGKRVTLQLDGRTFVFVR